MSANKKVDDVSNLSINNSNQNDNTPVGDVISQTDLNDDASPNLDVDDIEEIKYSGDASDLNQPDVYTWQSNMEMDPEMSTDDKIGTDKWAMPSSQKHQTSNCAVESKLDQNNGEECNNSANEELMVKLPPMKTKDSLTEDTNKDSEQSNSPKPDINSENSTTNDSSISETVDEELTVKLPPVSRGATNDVKCDGAESSDSLKQDKTDNVNDRSQSPMDDSSDSLEGVYQIKWVKFKGKDVPIITQNENGPCPLLAIMNVLLLKGKIKFTSDTEIISSEQMMAHLGECILADKPQNVTEVVQLNYEQNMHDAMAVIHKLQTGLDVNVRFNGVSEFEYTPECIIFDLLGISLYHGWLIDPQNHGEVSAIGNCSYNQLVEKIISQRISDNNDLITEALVAEGFLDRTASQLTYHGLCELSSTVKSDQLCVFFRNNHFCTLFRQKDELFLLVTDQGFLHERNVVWETLNNVEGDHYFVDSEFHTYTKPAPAEPVLPPDVSVNSDEQVNHDYLLAMSLQQELQYVEQIDRPDASQPQRQQRPQLSDAELAARLQAEEDAQAAHHAVQQPAQHHGNARPIPSGSHGQQRSRERENTRDRERPRDRSKDKDSNCSIL